MVLSQYSGQYTHNCTFRGSNSHRWFLLRSVRCHITQIVYVKVTFITYYLQLSKCHFQHCCGYFSSGFCEPSVVILCHVYCKTVTDSLLIKSDFRKICFPCLTFEFVFSMGFLSWFFRQKLEMEKMSLHYHIYFNNGLGDGLFWHFSTAFRCVKRSFTEHLPRCLNILNSNTLLPRVKKYHVYFSYIQNLAYKKVN